MSGKLNGAIEFLIHSERVGFRTILPVEALHESACECPAHRMVRAAKMLEQAVADIAEASQSSIVLSPQCRNSPDKTFN